VNDADDQRKYGRRAVAMRATVEILGRSHLACIIRNLSEGGALFELIEKAELPRNFGLRLYNSNATIECELTHRTGKACGVAFKSQDGIVGAAVRRAIRNTREALEA
jgi:hypothetical protein